MANSTSTAIRTAALCIFSCLVLCTPAVTAQNHALSLSLGYGQLTRQDLIFSPFVSRGSSPINVGLAYQKSRRWEQEWKLGFSQITAQHKPTFTYTLPGQADELQHTAPHSFLLADLSYTLGKRIAVRHKNTWWLFGAVSMDMDAMNYNHARISNFGYFISFDLSVGGKWRYQLSPRHQLTAEARLPLAAWVARSPYLINDDEFIDNIAGHKSLGTILNFIGDGQMMSPIHHQQITLDIGYDFALTRKWQLGLNYQLEQLHNNKPLPLHSAHQQISLRFSLHF